MNHKKFASWFSIIVILVISCSCSNPSKEPVAGNKKQVSKQSINLSYVEGFQEMEKAIYVFNTLNPDIFIKGEAIEFDKKTIDTFFNKLSTKRSNFNTREMKEALKIYKELYKLAPLFKDNSELINDPINGFKSNYYLFYRDSICSNSSLLLNRNSSFKKDLKEDLTFIPYPSWYGNGYLSAEPRYLTGIGNNCKNKEAAYKFIKFLLQDDSQSLKSNYDSFNYNIGYPVNKRAFKNDLITIKSSDTDKLGYDYTPISDELVTRFNFLVNNVGVQDYDRQIITIVSKSVKEYLKGNLSEDQTLNKIDNEVQIFLNE